MAYNIDITQPLARTVPRIFKSEDGHYFLVDNLGSTLGAIKIIEPDLWRLTTHGGRVNIVFEKVRQNIWAINEKYMSENSYSTYKPVETHNEHELSWIAGHFLQETINIRDGMFNGRESMLEAQHKELVALISRHTRELQVITQSQL